MSSWFYIAAAEYVMIMAFLHYAILKEGHKWPEGKWERAGAYCALALWPAVYLYMIGCFLWRASLKLVSKLLSAKR